MKKTLFLLLSLSFLVTMLFSNVVYGSTIYLPVEDSDEYLP